MGMLSVLPLYFPTLNTFFLPFILSSQTLHSSFYHSISFHPLHYTKLHTNCTIFHAFTPFLSRHMLFSDNSSPQHALLIGTLCLILFFHFLDLNTRTCKGKVSRHKPYLDWATTLLFQRAFGSSKNNPI